MSNSVEQEKIRRNIIFKFGSIQAFADKLGISRESLRYGLKTMNKNFVCTLIAEGVMSSQSPLVNYKTTAVPSDIMDKLKDLNDLVSMFQLTLKELHNQIEPNSNTETDRLKELLNKSYDKEDLKRKIIYKYGSVEKYAKSLGLKRQGLHYRFDHMTKGFIKELFEAGIIE